MKQPTAQPTAKMTAVGVSGAATLVIIYLLSLANVEIPAEVASALTILISFGSGYIKEN